MFKFNKALGLILIIFILLIVVPFSFAYENETNTSIDIDDNPLEIASDEGILREGNDYYFDVSLENDTGNGSFDNPYKYLTAARIADNSNIHLADGEYNLDYSKTINRVNFIGNGANKTILKYDGIIFTVSSSLTLTNLTIDGGTIFNNAKLNATNTVFSNSHGRQPDSYGNNFGGAIYCPKNTASTYLGNCTFLNNYAEYGGAIYANGGSLDIIDTMFINNFAYNFGGSIACEKGTKVSISKSKFANSTSRGDAGGAIYLKSSSLTIDDVEIADSSATFGGAIASLNSNVKLSYLEVHDSSAKWDGGAVYHMYGSFSSVNSTFSRNNAKNGGALFIDNSTDLILKSNSFNFNNASFCAGAVYSICNSLKSEGPLNETNDFNNNSAIFRNDEYEVSSIGFNIANGNYTMYRHNVSNYDLPSYYSLIDYNLVTVPKDQQTSGNCWAFAALSVLESAILKASGDSLDLSEENMKNVIAKYSDYGWNVETNDGGYFNMPLGYLVSWLGPVLESDDSFDDKSTLSPVLDSIMHVQNIAFFKRDNYTDNDAIKQAIMNYGAVGTSMAYYSNYYNSRTKGYCCYSSEVGNHMVSIVGWDDNYSKSNFLRSSNIEGDGAWIVANSWGTSWASGGYFYVSYYDRIFAQVGDDSSVFAFILNDTIRYERNYQYDIAGMTDYFYNGTNKFWYKNLFNASGDEYIAAVSTYFEKITDWTVSIFVNGDLKLVKNGTSNPGYFTIDLGQFIPVKAGDVFEVEFKVNSSGEASIPISEKISLNKLTYGPGISFISYDGENWYDFYYVSGSYSSHVYYSQVACIKAFTIINIINTTMDLTVGDDFTINVKVKDQYANLLNGNVALDINGFTYNLTLSNGIAVLTNPLLNQTCNVITAVFNQIGYNSSQSTATVDIEKTGTSLSMNISKISNRASIHLRSPDNINTSMIVKVNGEGYLVMFQDGEAYLNFSGLENGLYNVEVICENISAYQFDDLSDSFIMDTKRTRIISNDLIASEGSGVFNVTLVDENGNILAGEELVIVLNNQTFTKITDSNGNVSLPLNLTYGDYIIGISFNGDVDYMESTQSNNIKVKIDVGIDFTVDRSLNNVVVNVALSKLINESLTVIVNDKTYAINSTDGMASLKLFNLSNGIYNISVCLDDLDTFISLPANSTFLIDVKSTEIKSGDLVINDVDDFTFNVTLTDENGVALANKNITFVLNGIYYNEVTDGDGVAFIPLDLDGGLYEIAVAFEGDNDYFASGVTNFINVRTKVDIDLFAYAYQNSALIGINISKSINDSAVVVLNGNPNVIGLINGSALIILYNLTNGDYEVIVGLDSDKYDFLPMGLIFPIDVKETKIISNDLVTSEGTGLFNIVLVDENDEALADKELIIILNNQTFTRSTDSNGCVSIPLNLTPGDYSVDISFNGDLNYFESSQSNDIKVKMNVTIDFAVERIVNNAIVDVGLSKSINESLTVIVNDKSYIINSTDGKASLELFNLSNGIYNVSVILNDCDNYDCLPTNSSFAVDVKRTEIASSDLVINDDDDFAFNATLTDENGVPLANKNIDFVLNGVSYSRITDGDGIAFIPLDLDFGEYEILIGFAGDNDYFKTNASNIIKVKMKAGIGFAVERSLNNVIIDINVSKQVNDYVNVNVNEDHFVVALTNGNALLKLNNLSNGIYSFDISLNESDYEFVPAVSTFAVDVKKTEIISYDLNITDEDKVNFNATLTDENGIPLANRNITFVLNGIAYEMVTDSEGIAFIPIDLAGGKYDVTISYAGDNGHFASSRTNAINVKTEVDISVSVDISQNNAFISVNMSKAINETLNIVVNGKEYNVKSNNGKASLVLFNVSDLENGVAVKLGEDYNSAVVDSTIEKSNATCDEQNHFNVTVVDENNFILPNMEVTIVVNDVGYVMVTDDEGQVVIPVDLDLGEYPIEIYVKNDNDEFELIKSERIVVKSKVAIEYSIENRLYNTLINVNLSKAVKGTLEIVVDGKSHKLPINNQALALMLSNLDAGLHSLDIGILEDIYEYNQVSTQFYVDAKRTEILLSDIETYFQSGKEFTVTLVDEYGNPISGKDIQFKIQDNVQTAKTDDNGQATISINLDNGEYVIYVSFNGDNNYYNTSNAAKISVKSTIVLYDSLTKTYNSQYSFKLLDTNGNPLTNANVVFSLDGINYTGSSDNDGVVNVKITTQSENSNLIIYNPVNKESISKTISVSKRITQNKDIVIYEYSGSIYKVLILDDNGNPESAGKTVTFKIAGKTYTSNTDKDGYASLKISLGKRDCTVTATYKGFSVLNKVKIKSVLTAKNIAKKKAKSYKFQAKLVDKNGKALKGKKLTFKIKGKKYTAKTNKNGVATITIKLSLKVGSYKIYTSYGKSKITNTLKVKK